MNKVKVTIASLAIISGLTGSFVYGLDDSGYVDGVAGQCPLTINLSSQFDESYINSHTVDKIMFSVDCKTNLEEGKAFLNQGQVYYYEFGGDMTHRNFSDLVSVSDADYDLVKKQDSICTQYTIGTDKNPLNLNMSKDITFSWTWITSEKLAMYELSIETSDGLIYPVIMNGDDYYTVEIAEEMKSDKENTVICNDEYLFPIKGRYCITSVYGWDEDRYHDALDIVPYDDYNIYSSCDGTVVWAGENGGYGNYVSVLTDDGVYRFCYGHLESINVSYGQRVSKGDILGVTGSTGYSTGLHLDYSLMKNEQEANIAEFMGITNDYGDYGDFYGNANPNTDIIMKCLAINKEFESGGLGANAIRPNDSGAVALGMCQWNGCNARDMLRHLYEQHRDVYTNIAHKYNDSYVSIINNDDSWWSNHVIEEGGNEYKFYTELLDNDLMIESQYEYACNYMSRIVDDAYENGITDDRSVMIFSKVYNVLPYGGVAEKMRNGAKDFDSACSVLRADTNTNRHEEVIEFASGEVEYVTIDTLKGER